MPVAHDHVTLSCGKTFTLSMPKSLLEKFSIAEGDRVRIEADFDSLQIRLALDASGVLLRWEARRAFYTTSTAGRFSRWPKHNRLILPHEFIITSEPMLVLDFSGVRGFIVPKTKSSKERPQLPKAFSEPVDNANLLIKTADNAYRFALPQSELFDLSLKLAKRGFLLED